MITREDFEKAFPAFRGGLRSVVPMMLAAGHQQSIPRGSRIYAEGDACEAIAFVLSGEIRVFKMARPAGRLPFTGSDRERRAF